MKSKRFWLRFLSRVSTGTGEWDMSFIQAPDENSMIVGVALSLAVNSPVLDDGGTGQARVILTPPADAQDVILASLVGRVVQSAGTSSSNAVATSIYVPLKVMVHPLQKIYLGVLDDSSGSIEVTAHACVYCEST